MEHSRAYLFSEVSRRQLQVFQEILLHETPSSLVPRLSYPYALGPSRSGADSREPGGNNSNKSCEQHDDVRNGEGTFSLPPLRPRTATVDTIITYLLLAATRYLYCQIILEEDAIRSTNQESSYWRHALRAWGVSGLGEREERPWLYRTV